MEKKQLDLVVLLNLRETLDGIDTALKRGSGGINNKISLEKLLNMIGYSKSYKFIKSRKRTDNKVDKTSYK